MSIQLKEENGGTMLAVYVSGKYFSNIERRADADVARTWLAGDSGKQHE